MLRGDEQPELVVLCSDRDDRPPGMGPVEERMRVQYTDAARLAEAVRLADALLLWDFFSTALHDVWSVQQRLRWVHVAAAGVDKLLFADLRESDVVVTNARGIFDRPIAEFVLASILAHAKDVHRSHDLQRARRWRHRETLPVTGRRVLVVGTGAIGRETARLLGAVGMEVWGAGRSAREDDADFARVVASSQLAAHIGGFDYVVVVAPLTDRTRGLVDARILSAMRPSSYLVNVGRGATVVEDDLCSALRSGQIAGAALDVFEREPLSPEDPLWTVPGLVITAHMSGDAVGWRDALVEQFVTNALRWVDGKPLENVVDKRLGFVPASVP